jgi:hypothetical protein
MMRALTVRAPWGGRAQRTNFDVDLDLNFHGAIVVGWGQRGFAT